jgi:hypothetical protein
MFFSWNKCRDGWKGFKQRISALIVYSATGKFIKQHKCCGMCRSILISSLTPYILTKDKLFYRTYSDLSVFSQLHIYETLLHSFKGLKNMAYGNM